jgi:hypothetical protein
MPFQYLVEKAKKNKVLLHLNNPSKKIKGIKL